jgi:hypothetical protein
MGSGVYKGVQWRGEGCAGVVRRPADGPEKFAAHKIIAVHSWLHAYDAKYHSCIFFLYVSYMERGGSYQLAFAFAGGTWHIRSSRSKSCRRSAVATAAV